MFCRSIIAAAALCASVSAQAANPCLPQAEAEALVLSLAPGLVGTTAAVCAASLPAGAYLRRSVAPLTAKFAAEGEAAWPLAKRGLDKLAGPDAAAMLESELARPMVTAMVAPMLTREIRTSDCPDIDRVLGLIAPLPAKNTAALLVTIVDLAGRNKASVAGRGAFSVCRPGARP